MIEITLSGRNVTFKFSLTVEEFKDKEIRNAITEADNHENKVIYSVQVIADRCNEIKASHQVKCN